MKCLGLGISFFGRKINYTNVLNIFWYIDINMGQVQLTFHSYFFYFNTLCFKIKEICNIFFKLKGMKNNRLKHPFEIQVFDNEHTYQIPHSQRNSVLVYKWND